MRIKIALGPKDLDLLILSQCKNFHFARQARNAIVNYVRHQETPIPLPEYQITPIKKSVQVNVCLPDDNDISQWVASIQKGYRSIVIKTILRHCLETPFITPFLNSSASFEKPKQQFSQDKKKKSRSTQKTKSSRPTSNSPKPITESESNQDLDSDVFDIFSMVQNY